MRDAAALICRALSAESALEEKQRAFNEIVLRFQDMAFGCAYAVLGDFQLAEDAAQEAFLSAWRNLDRLRTPEAFPGWFKRIVLTQCRRLTRNKTLDTTPLDRLFSVEDTHSPDPFTSMALTETKNEVYAAILTLPPNERIVTTLFYLNSQAQEDIAAFLELPLTTVKKRLYSARQRLKVTLLAMIQDALISHRPSRDGQFAGTVALYNAALESFVNKVKQDRNIIAVLLFGSLSYDTVWKKSDIDLILLTRQEKQPTKLLALIENGIHIHAEVLPRNQFKRAIDGSLQDSFFHSTFAKSTLLYTTDETIRDYYENVDHLGAHDREMQWMTAANGLIYSLTKAEKWLTVKRDLEYTFLWLMYSVNALAKMETLRHNRLTSREMIPQAQKLNPELFERVYTDLIQAPAKDAARLQEALDTFHHYLSSYVDEFARPLLDYLKTQDRPVTSSEIDRYFSSHTNGTSLGTLLEWLAERGTLQIVPSPVRLTDKSPVATVEEAAYYLP